MTQEQELLTGIIDSESHEARRLYGLYVPAEKYNIIKRLADLLAQHTDSKVNLKTARKRAVKIAFQALVLMDPNAGWYLDYF